MDGKTKILSMLSGSEGSISGQTLCESLHVSRTAVWKAINQLRDEGYEIESAPGRGYRIASRPDTVSPREIQSRLHTKWAAQTVYFYESIGSTNNEAQRLFESGAPAGTLVVAETQNEGKGRRGRSWVTPAGSAIAMSLLLKPDIPPRRAPMLTLVMGMAVASACQKTCGVSFGIKWPNDVVFDGKKICGILTEMSCEVDYINDVVIGVGINTGVDEFPPELANKAISMHEITGTRPSRAALIDLCMEEFERYYEIFLKTGDFSFLKQEYNDILLGKNEKVRIQSPSGEWEGILMGINDMGELMVRRQDGNMEAVYAGEVSVKGIYDGGR